jgi:hypothetical protein
MAKSFYTERDIVDLIRQGVRSLIVDDDVVLTDLAYEKARGLGMELLRQDDQPPGAPVRPYIAKLASPSASATSDIGTSKSSTPAQLQSIPVPAAKDDLQQRVYQAALARLGDSVDPTLLEIIVQRVLKSVSTK